MYRFKPTEACNRKTKIFNVIKVYVHKNGGGGEGAYKCDIKF